MFQLSRKAYCVHTKIYPVKYVTLHFRDTRGTALFRYRNRAEITVLMSEQNPYPLWFSGRRKSCPVSYEHCLNLWLGPSASQRRNPCSGSRWIALSTGWITIQRIGARETKCAIQWIVIYPEDSVINLFYNWDHDRPVKSHCSICQSGPSCSKLG